MNIQTLKTLKKGDSIIVINCLLDSKHPKNATVVFVHPENRFVVANVMGFYNETFYPEEVFLTDEDVKINKKDTKKSTIDLIDDFLEENNIDDIDDLL